MFPAEFFSKFIDVGHYIQEIGAYETLRAEFRHVLVSVGGASIIDICATQDTDGLKQQQNIDSCNMKREPLGYIAQYALLEQLGAGAFGCVYRVKKKGSDNQLALKEIFMNRCGWTEQVYVQCPHSSGTLSREAQQTDKSFGDIVSETKIIKQQLRHPNIVRYRRVFVESM
jgi:NIMA (never in mitosis gene a)-related kinase